MSTLQSDVTKVETQVVGILARNWYWVALGCSVVCFILGVLAGHAF